MEREIRRNQNYLVILGTGVLAFAAWTVVRTVVQLFLQRKEIEAMIASSAPPEMVNNVMIVMMITIFSVLAVDLILRMFVGFSARSEGKGKKKRIGYLIAAFILIAVYAISIGTAIPLLFSNPEEILETIIGIVIDITSAITIIQLIMASVRLRKLTAQKQ